MGVSPLNDSVLRDHTLELMHHYYFLGTLVNGKRPQITVF